MLRKNKGRFLLTLLLLTMYSTIFGLVLSSTIYTPVPTILTFIFIAPITAYLLGMVWRYDLVPRELSESNVERSAKRKREVIDDVLRDLSDEDLVRLQRRLQNGSINDDVLYEQLGDDGEWTRNQKRR